MSETHAKRKSDQLISTLQRTFNELKKDKLLENMDIGDYVEESLMLVYRLRKKGMLEFVKLLAEFDISSPPESSQKRTQLSYFS